MLVKIGMILLKLWLKEGLVIMNGIVVMIGLVCLVW